MKSIKTFLSLALVGILIAVMCIQVYAANASPKTTLTWYGQSFFILTSSSGARIAFDPYHIQNGIKYSPPPVTADVVFVSHNHFDHNNVGLLRNKPQVVGPIKTGFRASTLDIGKTKIPYFSVLTAHDDSQGNKFGMNTINVVTVDGVNIAHIGDLGTTLTADQIKQIGRVDILMIPVGGKYTIDAVGATKVVDQLKPKVIIPMHYKTPKIDIPLNSVEPFLNGKSNVIRNGDTYSFTAKSLPSKAVIIVLSYKG
jgi:L-ascorbate metabolism protein UlaG (beta-lactamase superfamily)